MAFYRQISNFYSYYRFLLKMLPLFFWIGLSHAGVLGWQKFPSRFPLSGSFTHVPRSYQMATPILSIHHSVLAEQPESTWLQSHTNSNANNPAFQLNHHKAEAFLRVHKRAANGDEALNRETSPSRTTNTAYSGVQGSTGLSEMEIAIIVVCSALGLLTCIIGLIFLARYYWKKYHGDSLGYQGVLQRDSSESSMGTTRVDVKEAMARYEESSANPSLLHPSDALLIKHHVCEQVVEKDSLLPYANGAAVIDRQEICPIDKTEKKVNDSCNEQNLSAKNKNVSSLILPEVLPSRTGLSQSDCSISSGTSNNPSYKYGNQVGYMSGYYGYPCDTTFGNVPRAQRSLLPSVSFRQSVDEVESPKILESQRTIDNDDEDNMQEVFENETSDVIQLEDIEDDQEDVEENGNSSANNSLVNLQADEVLSSADAYRLSGNNRALSLPESFGPDKSSEDIIDDDIDLDTNRPTDSGWGDTVKGQFRGSLPVLHLSVSPVEARTKMSTSYPTHEELSPKDVDKRSFRQTSASFMLPNTFGNTQVINDDDVAS